MTRIGQSLRSQPVRRSCEISSATSSAIATSDRHILFVALPYSTIDCRLPPPAKSASPRHELSHLGAEGRKSSRPTRRLSKGWRWAIRGTPPRSGTRSQQSPAPYCARLLSKVARQGAHVVTGGSRSARFDRDFFTEPTIFRGRHTGHKDR